MGFYRLLSIALLLIATCGSAQITLQLINSDADIRLSNHVKILVEEDAALTLDEVLPRKDEFQWTINDNPNYGFQDSGVWLHVSFSNVTDTRDWVIDLGFTQLDKVDFYLLSGEEILAQSQQGKKRLSQSYRFPTVKAQLPYATPVDLFVRIESQNTSLVAPIDIQSEDSHVREVFLDNLMWGLFYGSLLILGLYNFVLFFSNRDISLLAYVVYIASALVWQFVWGGHKHMLMPFGITPWLSDHVDLIFVVIGLGSGIFTYTFLQASQNAPRTAPAVKLCMVVLAALGLLSLFTVIAPVWQHGIVYLVSIVAITCYLIAGFESYSNQFLPARFFIFAWSILACCALIGLLSLVGVFPSNFFTTYCFQFGLFVQAALFSLALMDKSRNQLENDVQQATNDLLNNMEFIEEQNVRLDIARKDALKASHIKSQFLANMSHEIRTPLNAILGFSQELNRAPLPTETLEHVRTINAAADNLLNIVNDVLDVSKIEAGKLQINNLPFSPDEMLEEVSTLMAHSAHKKDLEFVYDVAPLPEKLIGDANRIKQVLNNLLSNALKFTSQGHVCLRATGRELEHGIYELQLRVEDTGIGISQKDRKKLFSAFSQVDDSLNRSYQGTGLGLVICQQLVKLMRGKVTLTSEPNEGSCFAVTIRTNLLNPNLSLTPDSRWQNKRVAVIDPYEETRLASEELLKNLGASVTGFDNYQRLKDLAASFDTLFVTLPISHLQQRPALFNLLMSTVDADVFLLYAGRQPFSQSPELSDYVRSQLRLPLTRLKLEELADCAAHQRDTDYDIPLQSLPAARVLAVDDMEMNLRLLKTWFGQSPLEFTLAYSGAEAVALCERQEFDLILMDVQMPNMDGLQASALIRRTDLNIGTPIIAVTAHAFKEEQDSLLQSGMDDYLPKPIDLAQLVELVQKWCTDEAHTPPELASVDWSLALKRANHNEDAARELMTEFCRQLRPIVEQIELHWRDQNMQETQAVVHKLHGACCYTGIPRLQSLCDEVEGALKLGHVNQVDARIPELISEAEIVVSECTRLLSQLDGQPPAAGIA